MYPSEYAYRGDSAYRTERTSANLRNYPNLVPAVQSEEYIHCDGTPLRLTDSDIGSEQYTTSDYYVWLSDETRSSQLLFIFPTRVNLTTITLHYYSDSSRGLPRLRFWAVPEDFGIWDALLSSYSYVDVAAVPPGAEPAGSSSVSIAINIRFNTKKLLLYKYSSSFNFAMSEVEFTNCNGKVYSVVIVSCKIKITCHIQNLDTIQGCWYITESISQQVSTTPHSVWPNYKETEISFITKAAVTTSLNTRSTYPVPPPQDYVDISEIGSCILNSGVKSGSSRYNIIVREAVAWTVAAVSMVLFVVSLTVNMTMLWLRYKKRQAKDNNVEAPMYEMEGNPCYEASSMKQTTDSTGVQEVHLYERVKLNETN